MAEIKALLEEAGLATDGTKPVLLERLEEVRIKILPAAETIPNPPDPGEGPAADPSLPSSRCISTSRRPTAPTNPTPEPAPAPDPEPAPAADPEPAPAADPEAAPRPAGGSASPRPRGSPSPARPGSRGVPRRRRRTPTKTRMEARSTCSSRRPRRRDRIPKVDCAKGASPSRISEAAMALLEFESERGARGRGDRAGV